ncbi:MAG: DUF4373 domain-containing protein [Coriobacteriaceae bacterium]|jgi:hypothetical protein|nr:DUF4373 domain-containing protein [Coriobacteriaceae bacterium]
MANRHWIKLDFAWYSDDKCKALRRSGGWEALGLYVALVTKAREMEQGHIDLSCEDVLENVLEDLHVTKRRLFAAIDKMAACGLFFADIWERERCVSSSRMMHDNDRYLDNKAKVYLAGKASGKARREAAEARAAGTVQEPGGCPAEAAQDPDG